MESNAIYPFTSKQLKRVFYSHGVGLRSLGIVAMCCTVDALKQICIEEMVARSIKKTINFSFSEKFFQTKKCYTKLRKYQENREKGRTKVEKENSVTSSKHSHSKKGTKKSKSNSMRGKSGSFFGA